MINTTDSSNPMERIEYGLLVHDENVIMSAFENAIRNRVSVFTAGYESTDGRYLAKVIEVNKKPWIIMFTSPEHFRKENGIVFIALKDIAQLLDSLYSENLYPEGVMINPFSDQSFGIKAWAVADMIKRSRRNTWGKGIPQNYYKCELMTRQDLIQFAFETINDNLLHNSNITITDSNEFSPRIPYLSGVQNNQKVIIYVMVDIAPKKPAFSEKIKGTLSRYAIRNGFERCYCVPISFGSVDADRFSSSLALRGDGFYCWSSGLQEISLSD